VNWEDFSFFPIDWLIGGLEQLVGYKLSPSGGVYGKFIAWGFGEGVTAGKLFSLSGYLLLKGGGF